MKQAARVIFKHTKTKAVGQLVAVVARYEKIVPLADIYIHEDGTISEWHCSVEGEFAGSTKRLMQNEVELTIL